MHLIALGMNHRSAPVEVREKLAFSSGMMQSVVTDLKGFPSVGGFIVLSTCNRTEIYASVLRVQDGTCDLKGIFAGWHSYLKMRYLAIFMFGDVRRLLNTSFV